MTFTLRFLPEVEDDAVSGYVWYETRSAGLGDDLLRMFYAAPQTFPGIPWFIKKSTVSSDVVY